jgi:outer membrane protein TolC
MASLLARLALVLPLASAPPDVLRFQDLTGILVERKAGARECFQIRVAFWDALLAKRRVEALTRERDDFSGLISMNERRFGEGVIAERDLIKVRLEAGRTDVEVAEARLGYDEARRALERLLGNRPGSAVEVEGTFDAAPPPLPASLDPKQEDLETAAASYESAREASLTFRLRLLQQAEESAAIERMLYEQGKTLLVTLLDAMRTLTAVRIEYEATLHRAATGRLRLAYLQGEDLKP